MFAVRKIALFLSMICSLMQIQSARSDYYLNAIVNSLEDILTFCVENEHILDVNLLFGVTIVSSQLNFVETREMDPKIYRKLIHVKNLCDIIFKMALRDNIGNINLDETQRKLFSTKLWSFDVTPSHLQTSIEPSWSISNSNGIKPHDFINSSTFQSKYDFCIRSLIEKCHVSKQCEELILIVNGTEYVPTHQILYLLVLRQLILQNWCSFEDSADDRLNKIEFWLNDKCLQIYQNEFTHLENGDHLLLNNASLADLFIEQVVVCGLQSYVEFFQYKYIDYILKQNISLDIISTKLDDKINFDPDRILGAVHLISVRIAAMVLYVKHMSRNSISHLEHWSPSYSSYSSHYKI